MKKTNLVGWIVGIIVMVATALIWWLALSDLCGYPMFWLCFATVMGLELVTTWLFSCTEGDPRLVARGVAFLMETVLMVVVSQLFLHLDLLWDAYESYLIILVATGAVGLMLAVWLTVNYRRNTQSHEKVQETQAYLLRSREVVSIMQGYEHAGKYRQQLDTLEDDLRYALGSVRCDLDEQIHQRLCALAEQVRCDGTDVLRIYEDVRHLIRRRREQAKR